MARKKVTVADLWADFDKVRPFMSGEANLLPMAGDDSKCVLVQGDGCQTFSCRVLKSHLEFMIKTVGV